MATGVEFSFGGKTYMVNATKEVVLCAGKDIYTSKNVVMLAYRLRYLRHVSVTADP